MTTLNERPRPVGQILAMISIFCGVASGVCLKLASGMPSTQAVITRAVVAFVIVLLITFISSNKARFTLDRPTLIRAMLDGTAGFCFAIAVFELPISLLTAFLSALPAFSTLLAAIVLDEKPNPIVWLGIAGAFVGCLIILRPAIEFSTLGVVLAIGGNIGFAARDVYTRKVGDDLSAHSSVLLSFCFVIAFSLIFQSGEGWSVPASFDGVFAALAGVFGVGAGLLIALAHQKEMVSKLAPLRFTSLLWALLLDWAIWQFVPDRTAWIGIFVTTVSVFIVLHQTRARSSNKGNSQ